MAQFFTWPITKYIVAVSGINSNLFKIILSAGICLVLAVFFYEWIEKPAKKLFIRYWNKRA